MEYLADQAWPVWEVSDGLLARVNRIPLLVNRQMLLFKATGGFKYMSYFKASEAEVREEAKKAIAQMYDMQLRLAVVDDMLQNTSMMNRCIETYEERVKKLLVVLVGQEVIEAEPEVIEAEPEKPAPIAEPMTDEDYMVREFIWCNHGCSSGTRYGDDGEMQCSGGELHRSIDFRRERLAEILETLRAAYLAKAAGV